MLSLGRQPVAPRATRAPWFGGTPGGTGPRFLGPAGAASPELAAQGTRVQAIADEHELGAPRRVTPRLVEAQARARPRALQEAASRLAREVHEPLGANQGVAQARQDVQQRLGE